jgi:hypothetical protein
MRAPDCPVMHNPEPGGLVAAKRQIGGTVCGPPQLAPFTMSDECFRDLNCVIAESPNRNAY